jgi:hypothetical protein
MRLTTQHHQHEAAITARGWYIITTRGWHIITTQGWLIINMKLEIFNTRLESQHEAENHQH